MNELLQKHGCSTIFSIPEGLEELMSDITREVLRWQPTRTIDFIASYLSTLLITRDQGLMAVKMLDYLCDCRPTVSEHLLQIGLERAQADDLAAIIKAEFDKEGEKVKEIDILKKVLHRYPLNEEMSVKVCQVARNAYRDYWYRKNSMEMATMSEPGEKKALEESMQQATAQALRATEKIQAAFRGHLVRKNVQKYKKKMPTRQMELPGPPLDIATSREIDLGPVIQIKVKEDDVGSMFDEEAGENLGLKYDPKKTITNKAEDFLKQKTQVYSAKVSVMEMVLSKPSFSTAGDVPVLSDHQKAKTNPISKLGEHYEKHRRISFAESPSVIIKYPDEEALEVPEVPGISVQTVEDINPRGNFDVPEE